MARFYFQQYLNGRRLAPDRRGQESGSAAEACSYAFRREPGLLRTTLRNAAKDTFLSTEISDGTHTLFIIGGKVTSEKA
jgi:hypothetical protein